MKIILTIAIALSSFAAIAQTTIPSSTTVPAPVPPVAPKPTFKPDLSLILPADIKLKFPGNVVFDYLFYSNNGEAAISHSNDMTAARATEIKDNYKRVSDSLSANIIVAYITYINLQQKKFTADTTAVKKGGVKK